MLTIDITTSNNKTQADANEMIVRALRDLATKIERQGVPGDARYVIRDVNGNKIGSCMGGDDID